MKTSLKMETKGVSVQTESQGFMAAVDAVAALTKVGYWGRYCDHPGILSFLGVDKGHRMRMVGAIRHGDRTAFHISFDGDLAHNGDWILRINVSKGKKPFAFVEIQFDDLSGSVEKVLFHHLPPADQVRWD